MDNFHHFRDTTDEAEHDHSLRFFGSARSQNCSKSKDRTPSPIGVCVALESAIVR